MRIHPVFHVILLEPFQDESNNPNINCPDPIEVDKKEEYRVEKILDSRIDGRGKNKKRQYLVKWEEYHGSNNTWEDKENIIKAEALDIFLRGKKKLLKLLYGFNTLRKSLEKAHKKH